MRCECGDWHPAPARLTLAPQEAHVWYLDPLGLADDAPAMAALLSPQERQRAAAFRTEQLQIRYVRSHALTRRILGRYLDVEPAALAFRSSPEGKPELADDAPAMAALLSPQERQRAAAFRTEQLQIRYVRSHALTRRILGRYLGVEPSAVAFRSSPAGKPELADPDGTIRFSLSHSGDLTLLAVTMEGPVGVDIEIVQSIPDAEAIAERFFSPAERHALTALPPEERLTAFYRCWTRKEALVKALGGGLRIPLDRFTVSLAATPGNALLAIADDIAQFECWQVLSLELPGAPRDVVSAPPPVAQTPSAIGALAIESPDARMVCYLAPPE